MKKSVILSILSVFLITIFLGGCGSKDQTTLNVYNWGDYIDSSVIKQFEKETGIKVNYDTFATNEEMYVKINKGNASYDIAIPSDYMIEKMIKEGLVEKIDFNNIPNYQYIEDRFKNLEFDPTNEYSVPYMWGTLGILYNKKMVDEPVDSWDILWNPKYEKQILMLDSQRDSLAVALKKLNYSMNSTNDAELEAAKNALIEQRPLVLAYVGDEVKDKMIGEEAALAVVWGGDAVTMHRENPDLEYVIPKEGTNLFVDSIVIPSTAKHKAEAEKFIDFLCRTDIAFKNTDYIGYSTPHMEARKQLDPELANSPIAYPEPEDLENAEIFIDLGTYIEQYNRVWTEIKSH
ncbi:MAG: spermidine/putrescine ABC transporter substrate-binding protein [Epulopiscium sp.]|nr:spermidine/putrescine ABC transporter substrate-binding protein [Candidatus Epulonipiscium sp.]